MYQCEVDVEMLNAVKSVLADVSSVSPSSEQLSLETLRANILFTLLQHIHINLTLIRSTLYHHVDTDQNLVLTGTSIPL